MTAETPGADQPLDLGALSRADSPEVVRAALRRFRRRVVVRSLWIVWAAVVVFALAIVPRLHSSSEYLPRRFIDAQGVELGVSLRSGPVTVLVLDARRLSEDEVGIHAVVTASGLRDDEELRVDPGLSGVIEVFRPDGGPKPPDPPQSIAVGAGAALEVWFAAERGTERFSFDVAALMESGPLGTRARPPPPGATVSSIPSGEPRQCAVPLSPFGECPLYRDEGRLLATIRIDMNALRVPAWVWR